MDEKDYKTYTARRWTEFESSVNRMELNIDVVIIDN